MPLVSELRNNAWPKWLSLAALAACGTPTSRPISAWRPIESPIRLSWDYVTDFHALPLAGRLPVEPWADDYWADSHGGITRRWPGMPAGFRLENYLSPERIRQLPRQALMALSPAEKLDLIRGDLTLGTVDKEKRRIDRPNLTDWEGLCHGWSNASLRFQEPKPIVFRSPLGIDVPLGSSDVKAMLTWAFAQSDAPRRSIGRTCPFAASDASYKTAQDCNDTHPGAFHIILANEVALLKNGFVIDAVPDLPVWNHPVFAYVSRVESFGEPGPDASPRAVMSAVLETRVEYEAEIAPEWKAGKHRVEQKTYRYTLELDVNNAIVGGEWLPVRGVINKPDTIWTWDTPEFQGDYAVLAQIYAASIAGN